ncbi:MULTISPECIES: TcaA 3rd/4th domain-containing protein [Bacillus cereus group]|uniref:TcaA 3rd/4th domain-containing protein n=1 Tax=Bacillus cereus group TaxID=86661 RepID=UPI000BF5D7CB|nr:MULTISPECIES: YARHG domain-containing protein [Bacillus cereus group]PFO85724.1 zinc ribbon domain-containing protein [Bacillus cereus]PFR21903.1 zinc ribbon domain-containing protein [Bacillus cereus]PGZ17473.1 zinc ribbon domain-containing protein [Bacillus cereus]
MKVCTKCGSQLMDGVQFCQSCGTRRNDEESHMRRKMSTAKKIWIGVIILLILSLSGAYMYGAKYYSAEAQIDRMITILQEKDAEKFIEIVTTDDPQFVIDKESVVPLFAYIKEFPSYVNDLKGSIQQQKKKRNDVEKVDFVLTKDGKYLFLFDRYKLKAKTYYTSLLTDEKGALLKVNGKELDKATDKMFEKQYGPFFPGVQTFQSEFKNDYVKLTREEKVVLMKQNQNNVTVDLSLKGHYITIQTNVAGATLYANQKPITTLTGEEFKWGPVATDGSVSIYLEKEGASGKERTKVEHISTNQYYTLSFPQKTEEQPKPPSSPPVTTRYVYNGFFFPDSHIRRLTSVELNLLTKEQLRIARNEIYARHGHIFQTKDMQAYFLKQSWYRENPYYKGELNDIEAYNVEFIKSKE